MSFSTEAISAIQLSVWVAAWATIISLPFAIFIAYILARKAFWGKQILNASIHLSLVLPPVVTGYLLLILLGKNGYIGGFLYQNFGISFAFHWTGAVIAAAVMSFPLSVRAIRQAIEAIDPHMELAARSLGASAIRTFWKISLPLAMPGVIVGAILSFAKAMGEFGATITFASSIPGQTQTLPIAIYNELQTIGGEKVVLSLALVSISISICAVWLSEVINKRIQRKLF